jgi:hypothetical protein
LASTVGGLNKNAPPSVSKTVSRNISKTGVSYMRKAFMTLAILFFVLTGYNQVLSNLDKKYGIGIFKLESDFKLYKNLEFVIQGNDGVKSYKYKNKTPLKIFGVEASNVHLSFFKNKLYSISYHFDPLATYDISTIKSGLTELFGTASSGNNNTPLNYEWADIWQTKNTYLHFAKYGESSESYSNNFESLMLSNVIRNKILNSNF